MGSAPPSVPPGCCYKRPALLVSQGQDTSFPRSKLDIFSPFATMLFKSTIVTALVELASAAVLKRQSISTLSESQISGYTPYTYFAAAAKCNPSLTQTWSCGGTHAMLSCLLKILTHSSSSPVNCEANPSFIPYAVGGDGDGVQYCAHIH